MSVDHYTNLKLIGRGNYGEAWLVKHKKEKKKYVLKKVDLRCASENERLATKQEARLLSELKHPNIVAYKDSFTTSNGFLCIIMGFCEGGDLYNCLQQQNGVPLDELQIVEWFVQIAMALKHMHDKHILHRDLKTQNIFLSKSGIIKVGDLGIARVLEGSNSMATTMIGTPYYMSPELYSNKPYGYKSDVWALGCCVYEMATLKHAFDAKNFNSLAFRVLRGKMPAMPDMYPTGLVHLIKAMLNKNPEKRPTVDRILRDPYVKRHIAMFLEKTKLKQPCSVNNKQGRRNSADLATSSSKPAMSQPILTSLSKGRVCQSLETLHFGPDLAPISEETGMQSISERTIRLESSSGATVIGRISSLSALNRKIVGDEAQDSADDSDRVKYSPCAKATDHEESHAKSSATSLQLVNSEIPVESLSRRERRRKRRLAEISKLLKDSDNNPRVLSQNSKRAEYSNDIDKVSSSYVSEVHHVGSYSALSDSEEVNHRHIVESVQFLGNNVIFHREVKPNVDIYTRFSKLKNQLPDSAAGVDDMPVGKSDVHNDHRVHRASFPATILQDDVANVRTSIESVKHSHPEDLVKRFETPVPKSNSKITAGRVRKFSSDSQGRRASSLDSEQRREGDAGFHIPKNKLSVDRELEKVKTSDNTSGANQSSVLNKVKLPLVMGRPLPPRPTKSSQEPKSFQTSNKVVVPANQCLSNGDSTSLPSSTESSTNSSKDDSADVGVNSLHSSSRCRRRKRKEQERTNVDKSTDTSLPHANKETYQALDVHLRNGHLSSVYTNGFIEKMDDMVFHSADLVRAPWQREPLSEKEISQQTHFTPRVHHSSDVNKKIPFIDELESSSSDSSTEDSMAVQGKKKRPCGNTEMNSFIAALCSTLRIKEQKIDEKENVSEDEMEDGTLTSTKPVSAIDEPLFIKCPLPQFVKTASDGVRQSPADIHDISDEDQDSDKFNTPMGRLYERIRALRDDCLRGIGEEKLDKILRLLDSFDIEDIQPKLVQLLGQDTFANFAGKIWHLKFCLKNAKT